MSRGPLIDEHLPQRVRPLTWPALPLTTVAELARINPCVSENLTTSPYSKSATCVGARSEIRLVRTRYLGVLSNIVFMRIFGADNFRPLGRQSASIRDGC